jgi:hypothetical protein
MVELVHSCSFTTGCEESRITCHALLPERRLLFAGMADGTIAVWRPRL